MLYPLPFEPTKYLSYGCGSISDILAITDLTGRKIMNLQGKKDKINLSDLKSGVYLLQMKVNSKVLNLRVIKQ